MRVSVLGTISNEVTSVRIIFQFVTVLLLVIPVTSFKTHIAQFISLNAYRIFHCVLGRESHWCEDSSSVIVTAVHCFTGNKVLSFSITDV